ncbi:diguanylate cyclase [Qingshengfaniella alkalisoli]|uniref:diguanylate cyclase n=1 Tax=Qingshengfaniella alkalisoli TaxID=2599296 RepID=A0A5B8IX66_9RHOB|nr:diguanylate cyclase [Qingshengfaniella alkalisoli]QDY69491.1 diguanylate cyclase [Qingshengfaniella alkalisoli]
MSGRILIYDGIATNRILLRCKLSAACYVVSQATTPDELAREISQNKPDLILLDIDSDPGGKLAICSATQGTHNNADVPLILLATNLTPDLRVAALRAGAADILPKPVNDSLLMARIRRTLRQSNTASEIEARDITSRQLGLAEAGATYSSPGHIALISPNAQAAHAWSARLEPVLSHRLSVMTREDALTTTARATAADAFVIGASKETYQDALRLIAELRSREDTRGSAMLLLLEDASSDQVAMALDLGASDIMASGFHAEELALRLNAQIRHKQQGDQLRRNMQTGLQMATRDPLTGLFNRRFAERHLQSIAAQAQSAGQPFALMVLDLDRFKAVNDTYGHAIGDIVLREVSSRLRSNLRAQDLVARMGGEEFLVVMPNTNHDEALTAGERLRQLVRGTPIRLQGDVSALTVTVSIGVAVGTGKVKDTTELFDRADKALYVAKADGRDQVSLDRPAA